MSVETLFHLMKATFPGLGHWPAYSKCSNNVNEWTEGSRGGKEDFRYRDKPTKWWRGSSTQMCTGNSKHVASHGRRCIPAGGLRQEPRVPDAALRTLDWFLLLAGSHGFWIGKSLKSSISKAWPSSRMQSKGAEADVWKNRELFHSLSGKKLDSFL